MIKKFENYIKESLNNDDYKKILNIINQLVDNGDIQLKNKTPQQITDLIVGKDKKYPQFGFENFIISASKGNFFLSEGDRSRMGDYVKQIKDLGFDTTKLEELYRSVKKQIDLEFEIDNIYQSGEYLENEREEEINNINDKIDELKPKVDQFYNILKSMSKDIVEKL